MLGSAKKFEKLQKSAKKLLLSQRSDKRVNKYLKQLKSDRGAKKSKNL